MSWRFQFIVIGEEEMTMLDHLGGHGEEVENKMEEGSRKVNENKMKVTQEEVNNVKINSPSFTPSSPSASTTPSILLSNSSWGTAHPPPFASPSAPPQTLHPIPSTPPPPPPPPPPPQPSTMREPTLTLYPPVEPIPTRATTPTSFYQQGTSEDSRSYMNGNHFPNDMRQPPNVTSLSSPIMLNSLAAATARAAVSGLPNLNDGLLSTSTQPPVVTTSPKPSLYLCADGGGTSVKVVIYSDANGGQWARGSAGPCNVKSVGPKAAVQAILQATHQALQTLGYVHPVPCEATETDSSFVANVSSAIGAKAPTNTNVSSDKVRHLTQQSYSNENGHRPRIQTQVERSLSRPGTPSLGTPGGGDASSSSQLSPSAGGGALYFDQLVFKKIWLGLAGIMHQPDIDLFRPYARRAFGLRNLDDDDGGVLRITNDGHLLASPCTLLPHVNSTVVLVAGTGTVGLAFRKTTSVQGGVPVAEGDARMGGGKEELQCVGINGGWGYLLGDEGSAFSVARLAIRSLLTDDDRRKSWALVNPPSPSSSVVSQRPRTLLPLYQDLLNYFGVPDCSSLVDRTYSDHGGVVPGGSAGLTATPSTAEESNGPAGKVNGHGAPSLPAKGGAPHSSKSSSASSSSSLSSSISSSDPTSSSPLSRSPSASASGSPESSFHTAETNRKVWMAEASRIVFKYAFSSEDEGQLVNGRSGGAKQKFEERDNDFKQDGDDDSDQSRSSLLQESRETALEIAREAVSHLVQQAVDLVKGSSHSRPRSLKTSSSSFNKKAFEKEDSVKHTFSIDPTQSLLSLGGGLWKVQGYVQLLIQGLEERGIVFREVRIIGDAPEEGVKALIEQDSRC